METKEYIIIGILMLIIIGLGLFAVNQGLSAFGKAQLLFTPCELCMEMNPNSELVYHYPLNYSSLVTTLK